MDVNDPIEKLRIEFRASARLLAYATHAAMVRDGAYKPGMTWTDGKAWLLQNTEKVMPLIKELSAKEEIGYPAGSLPSIQWNHIDGPLLHLRDGRLHWLTLWERIRLRLGLDTALTLERKNWASS